MRLFTYAALVLLVAASGCSSKKSKPENELLSNDFESLDGWGPETPSLTREKAHSGQYSIKIQKGIEYSLTYKKLLGQLSPTKINKIHVKAYALMTKPTGASLTAQLMGSTTPFSQNLSIGTKIKKPNEWTEIDQVFTLPADAAPTNELRIYMWGANGDETVYLDDLTVTKE